ncbi:YbaB/EbfC family nucleoid-associated protein [bacterium]|nr:MAG: YbaB/EbfC family nucleoid-associated protein [bacterium]
MMGKNFMKNLKKAQQAFGELDKRLVQMKIEFSAGGGMVTIVMNGKKELLDLKISPEVVDPDDIEMLQDLIIAAIRGAQEKVDDEVQSQMSQMAGMLGVDISNFPG